MPAETRPWILGSSGKLSERKERASSTALLGLCATLRGGGADSEPRTRGAPVRVSYSHRAGAAKGLSSALSRAAVSPREESLVPEGGCGLAQEKHWITTVILAASREYLDAPVRLCVCPGVDNVMN